MNTKFIREPSEEAKDIVQFNKRKMDITYYPDNLRHLINELYGLVSQAFIELLYDHIRFAEKHNTSFETDHIILNYLNYLGYDEYTANYVIRYKQMSNNQLLLVLHREYSIKVIDIIASNENLFQTCDYEWDIDKILISNKFNGNIPNEFLEEDTISGCCIIAVCYKLDIPLDKFYTDWYKKYFSKYYKDTLDKFYNVVYKILSYHLDGLDVDKMTHAGLLLDSMKTCKSLLVEGFEKDIIDGYIDGSIPFTEIEAKLQAEKLGVDMDDIDPSWAPSDILAYAKYGYSIINFYGSNYSVSSLDKIYKCYTKFGNDINRIPIECKEFTISSLVEFCKAFDDIDFIIRLINCNVQNCISEFSKYKDLIGKILDHGFTDNSMAVLEACIRYSEEKVFSIIDELPKFAKNTELEFIIEIRIEYGFKLYNYTIGKKDMGRLMKYIPKLDKDYGFVFNKKCSCATIEKVLYFIVYNKFDKDIKISLLKDAIKLESVDMLRYLDYLQWHASTAKDKVIVDFIMTEDIDTLIDKYMDKYNVLFNLEKYIDSALFGNKTYIERFYKVFQSVSDNHMQEVEREQERRRKERHEQKELAKKKERLELLEIANVIITQFIEDSNIHSINRFCYVYKIDRKLFEKYRDIVKIENKELAEVYDAKIKKIQKANLAIIKKNVDDIIDNINNNKDFTLFDYHKIMRGMEVDEFIDFVSKYDIYKKDMKSIRTFYSKNKKYMYYFNWGKELDDKWIIKNHEMTRNDKLRVIHYMDTYSMPYYRYLYNTIARKFVDSGLKFDF